MNVADLVSALDRSRSQASNLMDVLRAGHVPGVDELDAMCRSAAEVHQLCQLLASSPSSATSAQRHHHHHEPDGAWILPE